MASKPNSYPNSEDETESLAEGTRRRYLYRTMVLNGKTKIPARLAMKMVGPDCAFHLYREHHGDSEASDD